MEERNIKSSPLDVFMYILTAITLYWSAYAVIALFMAYINIWLPDPLQTFYNPGAAVRWPLASLIILFPVYVWSSRFLLKDIGRNPEKAEIRARKWILYLTLFLAAALIIGDLIALIYNFLGGELSSRFLLKVLAVLFVASGIFKYYFFDLRRRPGEPSPWANAVAWGGVAVVAAVVVVGFFAAGSPFKQREVRFDERRVSDLQSAQYQIVNYWQNKDKLPANLSDLTDSISGFTVPADPQTEEEYGYEATGGLSFKLCANFTLSSEEATAPIERLPSGGPKEGDNWKHDAGEYCFERSIDPELYRLNKSTPTGPSAVNSFSSCAAAGYPIQESQPRRCQVSNTKTFVELRGDVICAQVITPAEDPVTGESGIFPTPCDVPAGWIPTPQQPSRPD